MNSSGGSEHPDLTSGESGVSRSKFGAG